MSSRGVKSWSFGFLDYSLEDYKKCTQAGLKLGANIYGVYVSAGAHGGSCNGLLNEMGGEVPCQSSILAAIRAKLPSQSRVLAENTARGSMVEDFVSVVRGGSSESITALLSKKLPTPELMRLWGESVPFNPDFIRRTVSGLFSRRYFPVMILFIFTKDGQTQPKCSSVINTTLGNRQQTIPNSSGAS